MKDKYKRYFAYGGGANQTVSTGQKYQFTGQPYDDGAFDLYYYGARYYDPVLGRFTSRDQKAQMWSPLGTSNCLANVKKSESACQEFPDRRL